MRFKDIFAIIGPDMVGPSSSHTAGAVRIGRAARQLLGCRPEQAEVTLFKSFAETYRGHGTDVALAAGMLDWDTQDERIPEALNHAASIGLAIDFRRGEGSGSLGGTSHPNTARLNLKGPTCSVSVTGISIGGGNIEIVEIDGFDVRCSCAYPTVIISHQDTVGMLADITSLFKANSLNIGSMEVERRGRSAEALTVIEADRRFEPELLSSLRQLPGVMRIRTVDLAGEESRR